MRVLVAFNDYLEAGGERFSVETEVAALSAAGADVEVLRVDNTGLRDGGLADRARSVLGDPALLADLAERLDRFRPDVVHAENLFPQLGAGAIEAVASRGIPWVRTFRNYRLACVGGDLRRDGGPCTRCGDLRTRLPGIVHRCYRGSLGASLGATVQVSRDARAMRSHPPAAHLFVSDFMRGSLAGALGADVPAHVVPNAVDLPEPDAVPWRDRAYDAVYVGRLSQEKGLPLLLEAARALPHRSFAVVGTGPLADQVERDARELPHVRVLGQVAHDRLAEVVADARTVVVPSQWDEPFGRVSIEAQRMGAVPLVSDRGGLPETLPASHRDRLVVPAAEPRAWADAVEAVASWSPEEAAAFASEAASAWERDYSPAALAGRLMEIYQEACGPRG
ncbi:glycosyltransferase [Demequina sp. SYSU T00068]|uniref:glycosyltransferase n=1 Tax=Demequina lignilytica TaxID=3051663 RepID=UPI0026399BC3|nr:glycosyltransferase [Demequina sp. SYSU T00068]MDN4490669.1 glycosyltransferase [Demequina sp. SYSU T00068]